MKQENGRYGFVVEIEEGGKPYYAIVELDTKGNYHGKVERANVVVSAFGTNLKYIENQMRKGTELPIKKEPDSQVTHGRQLPYGINETDSNGDVPSPKTNIPQNRNGVNTLDAENSAAKAQQNSENAAKVQQRKPRKKQGCGRCMNRSRRANMREPKREKARRSLTRRLKRRRKTP